MKKRDQDGKINQRDEIGSLFHLTLTLHNLNKDVERKFKLSLVQLFVLLKLKELPAISAQILAREVGVHPSTLTQTLRRLLRKEFIFVTEDPKDSRKILIALTKRGRDTTDRVYKEVHCLFVDARITRKNEDPIETSLQYLTAARQRLMTV